VISPSNFPPVISPW